MKRFKNWQIRGAIRIGLLAVYLAGTLGAVQAKNLGQAGPVYPIVETNVMQRQEPDQRRRPHKFAHLSLPVALAETKQYLDLSYTVPRDITDAEGKVLYPEGYRFNPLEHRRFRTMVVIDGSDAKQVDWAENLEEAADPMTRIVITRGDKTAVSRRFKRRVYRLHSQVAERYRIASVPAIVQQKGAVLAVTTIPVN